MAALVSASTAYAWPSIALDRDLVLTLTKKLMAANCDYKLGGKAPSLSADSMSIKGIDCSGFVRWVIYRASGVAMPDGSVNQHDWVKEQGFKRSSVESAKSADGAVRIAFMSPADGGGIGHVALIMGDGRTCESHGGKVDRGPDRRPWTGTGWQAKANVYVLCPPTK